MAFAFMQTRSIQEHAMEEDEALSLQSKRILVLDANDQARQACLDALQRIGLQARGLRDRGGLAAALDEADLVVTEWGLGTGMNEGVFFFRQLEPWTHPVILYSRHPDHADREAAGLRHYVAKPDLTLLLKTIAMELIDPALNTLQTPNAVNVLLIEDSATIRGFLRRLFEQRLPGVRIVEAADGRAALNEMTRCRADLIVSDLQMPGMDGRSFIAKLRSNPILKKKSVLVLSGDDLQDLRALYRDDSGIRFLAKPSGADEIMQSALQLLDPQGKAADPSLQSQA
jgi:CheY-like chemotaxis protein